jgi:hypothetical protein
MVGESASLGCVVTKDQVEILMLGTKETRRGKGGYGRGREERTETSGNRKGLKASVGYFLSG